ncbi:hypothetical protein HZA87_00140 [Candidatus Uhrbacteria bacterium]|nr:hypothetical protein [Candidatus Uhrbacteria bacterium]
MKKFFYIFGLLVVLVLIVAVILSASKDFGRDKDTSVRPQDGTREVLTEDSCTASGGTWNSCGSACRTTPDAPCIEVCVEYCECTSDSQCPAGLLCSDVVDDVGVCL